MPLLLQDDTLCYDVQLFGYDASLFYKFSRSKLVSASYVIDDPVDVQDVAAYEVLLEELTKKYGEGHPGNEWRNQWEVWSPVTYGEIAKAVGTGQLQIRRFWWEAETNIALSLVEDRQRYNALTILSYGERDHDEKMRQDNWEDDSSLL